MDIVGADFGNVMEMMRTRLGAKPAAIQLPIGVESSFRGVIDLVEMCAKVYYDEEGEDVRREEIPEDMLDEAEAARNELIEAVADEDDIHSMLYLE